jgi:hypothetical protein
VCICIPTTQEKEEDNEFCKGRQEVKGYSKDMRRCQRRTGNEEKT